MEDKTLCPACGGMLIPVPRMERANVASWVLLILGLISAPVLIGIVLMIIAFSRGFTIKISGYFECSNCEWNSQTYTRTVKLTDAGEPVFESKAGVSVTKTPDWVYVIITFVIFGICVLCCTVGPCGAS